MKAIYKFLGCLLFVGPLSLLVSGVLKKLYIDQIPDALLYGLSGGFAATIWGMIMEAFALTLDIKKKLTQDKHKQSFGNNQ